MVMGGIQLDMVTATGILDTILITMEDIMVVIDIQQDAHITLEDQEVQAVADLARVADQIMGL